MLASVRLWQSLPMIIDGNLFTFFYLHHISLFHKLYIFHLVVHIVEINQKLICKETQIIDFLSPSWGLSLPKRKTSPESGLVYVLKLWALPNDKNQSQACNFGHFSFLPPTFCPWVNWSQWKWLHPTLQTLIKCALPSIPYARGQINYNKLHCALDQSRSLITITELCIVGTTQGGTKHDQREITRELLKINAHSTGISLILSCLSGTRLIVMNRSNFN